MNILSLLLAVKLVVLAPPEIDFRLKNELHRVMEPSNVYFKLLVPDSLWQKREIQKFLDLIKQYNKFLLDSKYDKQDQNGNSASDRFNQNLDDFTTTDDQDKFIIKSLKSENNSDFISITLILETFDGLNIKKKSAELSTTLHIFPINPEKFHKLVETEYTYFRSVMDKVKNLQDNTLKDKFILHLLGKIFLETEYYGSNDGKLYEENRKVLKGLMDKRIIKETKQKIELDPHFDVDRNGKNEMTSLGFESYSKIEGFEKNMTGSIRPQFNGGGDVKIKARSSDKNVKGFLLISKVSGEVGRRIYENFGKRKIYDRHGIVTSCFVIAICVFVFLVRKI